MRANSVSKLAVMGIVAEETTTTMKTKRQPKLTTIALETLAILLQATTITIQISRQSVYV